MHRLRSAAPSLARALVLLLMVLFGACDGIPASGFSGDVDVLLARGAAYASSLADQPAEDLTDGQILALGYLERARLGLGSPFRLIDFALNDPELPAMHREAVSYALLAQVLRGRIYEIDPSVLDLVHLSGVPIRRRIGSEQMRIIQRTLAAAPTPRSGERAVRLGYHLAEAERTVRTVPHSVVAHAAALLADRRRAREDAIALLRAAAEQEVNPLTLLQRWRRELRFRVEAPAIDVPSVREEEWEARDAPQVALALRTLAHRLSAPSAMAAGDGRGEREAPRSWLNPGTASRLEEIIVRRDYPPQAPVAVALSINREAFLGDRLLEEDALEARKRFVDEAWNEERLIVGYYQLRSSGAGRGQRLSLIVLQAATFLRGWNQEDPWFPGDPAPASKDLEARFGLAAVEFDPEVPEAWRPYYRRMLARGLIDLQRVMPTASVRGLRIRFGPLPEDVRALALHDPGSRTLILPPHTGSGTLAHEIAHDLDWQLARKRYGARGGYATDLAMRHQRRDRIATSLSGLAASLSRRDTLVSRHDTRPAEIFARGTDWFVAATLAREGRTGGYLTSYQDPALTGYGTTRSPDISGGTVPNLFAILDEVAPVVERTREWAMDQYGPSRTLSPRELSKAVVQAGQGLPPVERLDAIARARDRAISSVSTISCRLSSAEGMRRLVDAQRSLVQASTRAAMRGAAIDAIQELARENLELTSRRAVDDWVAWRLYGAPEPVDSTLQQMVPMFEDVLYRAELLAQNPPVELESEVWSDTGAPLCGANPFASVLARRPARLIPPRDTSGRGGTPSATTGPGWSTLPWFVED